MTLRRRPRGGAGGSGPGPETRSAKARPKAIASEVRAVGPASAEATPDAPGTGAVAGAVAGAGTEAGSGADTEAHGGAGRIPAEPVPELWPSADASPQGAALREVGPGQDVPPPQPSGPKAPQETAPASSQEAGWGRPARATRPVRPARPLGAVPARTPGGPAVHDGPDAPATRVDAPMVHREAARRGRRGRPWDAQRLATGIRLLDDLLGGGLPPASTVLLCGPSFLGKEVLARSAALRAMAAGVPCVYVVASKTPEEVHADLLALGEDAAAVIGDGLLHFVDAFSSTIGEKSAWPGTEATDGPDDLEGLDRVLSAFDERFRGHRHLVIVDSVSDLAVASPADRVFRFLQVTMGRARRARATCLLLMDEGMHGAEEVQMVRHLASGALTVRGDTTRRQILVEGLDVPENPGWIEYASTSSRFEMTGSLAGGRIR